MKTAALVLAAVVTSCLVSCITWTRIEDNTTTYRGRYFALEQPLGWNAILSADGDFLLLTKDGLDLQRIVVRRRSHAEAFPILASQTTADMLPSDLAELCIAELKAETQGGIPSLKILRNEPIVVSGHTGFSLHLSYKMDKGLEYQLLVRGFVDEDGVFLILYRAPALHFFKRDVQAFEEVFSSFEAISS